MISELIKGAMSPILDGVLRLIPDKNKRAEAKEQFEAQMLVAMTGLVQGQLEINKVEAQHRSIFVAGWRPGIGWVCGAALAWNFIVLPLVQWGAFLASYDLGSAPRLDTDELVTVLMGMLGLGGLRTYEKKLGVASNNMGDKKKGQP